MSGPEERREHVPGVDGELTLGQVDHRARVAAIDEHMRAARQAASHLVTRARILVRNGVDLRDPERVSDFIDDQVLDAVKEAQVYECTCGAAQGAAAVALLSEVTAALAQLMEGRER